MSKGKQAKCNTFVYRWDHETCAVCGVEHAFDSMGSRVDATVEAGDAKGLVVATLTARLLRAILRAQALDLMAPASWRDHEQYQKWVTGEADSPHWPALSAVAERMETDAAKARAAEARVAELELEAAGDPRADPRAGRGALARARWTLLRACAAAMRRARDLSGAADRCRAYAGRASNGREGEPSAAEWREMAVYRDAHAWSALTRAAALAEQASAVGEAERVLRWMGPHEPADSTAGAIADAVCRGCGGVRCRSTCALATLVGAK